MNKTVWFGVFVLILIAVGGIFYFWQDQEEVSDPETVVKEVEVVEKEEEEKPAEIEVKEEEKKVPVALEVKAKNFEFVPSRLEVQEGDQVTINFICEEGAHNLVLDEFEVETEVLEKDESVTVEFTADQVGEFEYYSSDEDDRDLGLVGTLVVKAKE